LGDGASTGGRAISSAPTRVAPPPILEPARTRKNFHTTAAQGANAKGGAKSYVVNGKMTGGFAFAAYPADYHSSGVMTFLIDQNGVIYQKDLGTKTADLAKAMTTFNPDKTWTRVPAGEALADVE
jgi:hypothetical protein